MDPIAAHVVEQTVQFWAGNIIHEFQHQLISPNSIISLCRVNKHGASLELTLENSFDMCSEYHLLFGTASMFAETYLAYLCSFSWVEMSLKKFVGHAQQWYRSVMCRFGTIFSKFGDGYHLGSFEKNLQLRLGKNGIEEWNNPFFGLSYRVLEVFRDSFSLYEHDPFSKKIPCFMTRVCDVWLFYSLFPFTYLLIIQ
jgi:hypothetical protein